MQRILGFAVLSFVLLGQAVQAQEQQPVDVGQREEVEVNLVIVDTLVLDKQGRTVGGLTKDDFLLSVQGKAQEIDTFDVICPDGGGTPDPKAIELKQHREPVGPEPERRLVLAFDYYSLSNPNRAAALGWGQVIVSRDMAPGDGIMIVALADGLRVEQGFSGSPSKALHTLERMEHDVTLYGRQFQPITPRAFLDNISTLMDVLAQYPGPKSVVLFSQWADRADDWDNFFLDTAQHAANARTTINPIWAPGLQAVDRAGGSPSLARLANESGGRFTRNVNDLSVGYARARRDLSCRYAIGYYSDPDVSRKARTVKVTAKGYQTRTPERVRLWTEEERRTSALRAAFADPGPNDDPLVRVFAYPFRPMSGKSWETFLAVSFPLHLDADGTRRDFGASLDAAHLNIKTAESLIDFPAPKDGQTGVRPATLYGVRKLKPGPHSLTVAIGEPGGGKLKTSRVEFVIPEVPQGDLIVRGPLLARVAEGGVRMRVDGRETDDSDLHDLIGDAGFEPLLVAQVTPSDALLAGWEICGVNAKEPPAGAVIERRIKMDGEVVHSLEPIPVAMEGKKKLRCQGGLDKLPGGTLDVGKYRFEVAVVAGGKDLGLGLRPFAISEPPEEGSTERAEAR